MTVSTRRDRPHRSAPRTLTALLLAVAGLALAVTPTEAQEPEVFRIGVTLGGTAFLGLSFEYIWDQTAIELDVGTWALRDLSVAVAGKQYLGEGTVRGFVGLGLWNVTAAQEEGVGSGLILRAPVGFELEAFDDTAIGAELNVSRALWIHRADPEDDTPPQDRIVPLPGFYLKWAQPR